ncbi:MAG: UTP--glucose-1-phosphate uridylyltransferase [Desulfobacterales bacterium]|nr:UTP--glucose-1-phosphate uridylyltransferase [Desulfobacterales bacterium]
MKHQPEIVGHLADFIAKMENESLAPLVIDTFAYYYQQVLGGETGLLSDSEIEPLTVDDVEHLDRLAAFEDTGRKALSKTVRIVLNGGLGTTMGLTGPKSLLKAEDSRSFLDIIIGQAQTAGVRLCLMNSFNTHADTLTALNAMGPKQPPDLFLQHKFPKILQDSLSPATWPVNPSLEWNPPGHGDIYTALSASGMLQTLIADGIEYAFISNSDNLGADLNLALLGYFAANHYPFMMEVARRTLADVKGGHLARHKSNRLILREAAQCPESEVESFRNVDRYQFFNTNSIWINLQHLEKTIRRQKIVRLPMILNPKTLDPRDAASPPVYQIETAMGSAVNLFDGATAVHVPRNRFFPVKSCNDLLLLRSDCYSIDEHHKICAKAADAQQVNEQGQTIQLDPQFYGRIDDFEKRFPKGYPSLKKCQSLQVTGDVFFGSNVTLLGSVSITNNRPASASIPDDTTITGHLSL